ncbi:MAG: CCA tRNA nucleotidyltransferase [Frankiaceae bacterium]
MTSPATAQLSRPQRDALTRLFRQAPEADHLGELFAAAGHQLHLVGGTVRDALIGRVGNDLDFTTDARPDQVRRIVSGYAEAIWETGIAFGTLSLRRGAHRLEITTYRSEAYARESRKPAVSYGDSLIDDLSRRDFTVNAMAVSLPEHHFADPYGGLRDLTDSVLRTPGRPEDSFSDDPLRMLRAARFAAQLAFDVDEPVMRAMADMADRISIVSVERVQGELTKLICSAHPRRGLELLVETRVADRVLPELPRLRLTADPLHRHKDVYEHTLTVLDQAIALENGEPDLVLRLAALLHDIGKPKTRAFSPGGGVSFHHHEAVGRDMARARLSALRYPRQVVDDVARLVELHLRFHGYGEAYWSDAAVRRYVTDAGPLLGRLHKLTRSDSTTRNRRKAAALTAAYDDLERRIAELSEQEQLAKIRPDLDGNEIMAVLGIPPGPLVGQAYRHLLEIRMERGPLPRDEVEAELRRWAADRG